jgi:hypothetical protein
MTPEELKQLDEEIAALDKAYAEAEALDNNRPLPDCEICGHLETEHAEPGNQCWHGTGQGQKCECQRYVPGEQEEPFDPKRWGWVGWDGQP